MQLQAITTADNLSMLARESVAPDLRARAFHLKEAAVLAEIPEETEIVTNYVARPEMLEEVSRCTYSGQLPLVFIPASIIPESGLPADVIANFNRELPFKPQVIVLEDRDDHIVGKDLRTPPCSTNFESLRLHLLDCCWYIAQGDI